MMPYQRKESVMHWLEREKTLSIATISYRLGVSEMTVYRDIKPLVEKGDIARITGGIVLREREPTPDHCAYCLKPNNRIHQAQMLYGDQQIEHFCCPHCVLLGYHHQAEKVDQLICRDFLRGTTISGKNAFFLLEADEILGCCSPQVLAFEKKEQAEKFTEGFGGRVFSFYSAVREVHKQMSGSCDCSE
ncbi:DeoR/GlpR transcriptional regulator [Salicibibacter cibi]|uniref:DeoR/GlpR transcriptional regulator n=1 Tax=Salicibibacter cibi TaxID=2743001 RepID=A0A7T6ZEA7_9BACI|nr:DeoR family transcriptional regulator [Salicibibacter cibi]QQK81702.1 DeoR/GlpR transcriptional regulator [Salicibibacter cibi]